MTRIVRRALLSGAIVLGFAAEFSSPSGAQSPPLITQAVQNGQRITLNGNTRFEANQANNVGAVPDNFEMPHMLLQLKRSAAQQQQLEQLAADVSNPASPKYRQFLTAAQFAAGYGPNSQDVQIITGWLQSQGFQVNAVHRTANIIDFSGTAGQVRAAFGTPIHQLNVNGETYIANMNDPQIPVALADAVIGPVALHNFPLKPSLTRMYPKVTGYYVVPGDLYTIYNWTPLFGLGITGKGQTIGIMSQSDTYGSTQSTLSTKDWDTFRNTFNLNSPPFAGTATLTALHPNGCSHSVNFPSDSEAATDVEYSSAAAPDANILLVSCDAGFPGGIIMALMGTVELPTPPGVISNSYGECEAQLGSVTNATINNLYLTASMLGISVFVASGDSLGYVCDGNGASFSTLGLSVNGTASTWWNVAVGGTDFMDSYLNQVSNFWNPTNRSSAAYLNWSSARSYIPEIPWNTSCASQLVASVYGFAITYGPSGFCNNSPGNTTFLHSYPGTSAGTSTLYLVPSWQLLFVPAGTTNRVLNDVSLIASHSAVDLNNVPIPDPAGNGIWGHGIPICYSGSTCNSTPTEWFVSGGTSFASPIWAGIQTLINQHAGRSQGLPTPAYYQLAALSMITNPGGCNSSRAGGPMTSCIFYDVTQGDNDAPCKAGSPNCYAPGGTYGVLSTSTTSYQPAFTAGIGWDFPTGLGTPNVFNLVRAWPGSGGLPQRVNTHDFNGDGFSDILLENTSGGIAMWLMGANATIQSAVAAGAITPNVWSVVGQRDLNGDGLADILFRANDGSIANWLMNSGTIMSVNGLGNPTTAWNIVGTGDFNGDGIGDILLSSSGNAVGIWFMNNSGTVASAVGVGSLPNSWTVAGTGDFNGDGVWDILWLNTANAGVGIWFMNTNGTLNSAVSVGSLPSGWSIAGTGDFSGDTISDILLSNTGNGVAIWFMNSSGMIASVQSVGTMLSGWTIAQTGDFNADGYSDILWYNSGSGAIATWLMNSATVIGAIGIGSVPPSSWMLLTANSD